MAQYSWVVNIFSPDASLQCAQVWRIRLRRIMLPRFEILLLKPPKSVTKALRTAQWLDWREDVSVLGRKKKKCPNLPVVLSCLLWWSLIRCHRSFRHMECSNLKSENLKLDDFFFFFLTWFWLLSSHQNQKNSLSNQWQNLCIIFWKLTLSFEM